MKTTTPRTLGELINHLFEAFEAAYGDAELAAVATEVTLNDLLFSSATGTIASAEPVLAHAA